MLENRYLYSEMIKKAPFYFKFPSFPIHNILHQIITTNMIFKLGIKWATTKKVNIIVLELVDGLAPNLKQLLVLHWQLCQKINYFDPYRELVQHLRKMRQIQKSNSDFGMPRHQIIVDKLIYITSVLILFMSLYIDIDYDWERQRSSGIKSAKNAI